MCVFSVLRQGVDDALRPDSEESPQGVLGLGFTRSRLFIDCFQPQDEGTYTCVAENAFERQSSSSQIEVAQSSQSLIETNDITLCTSKKSEYGMSSVIRFLNQHADNVNPCNLVICCVMITGSGARINMWTKTRLELIGSEVRLFCRTQGFPKPAITWLTPEGRLIVSSGRTRVTESGDLIIRELSWDDMGGYQCIAKNEGGEDQSTTFLYPMMVSPADHPLTFA